MIDGLRAATRALAIVVDTSAAASAARAAFERGESLPDCVRAFAEETDGEFDDELADALTELLTEIAEWSRLGGIQAIELRNRVAAVAPVVIELLDQAAIKASELADLADRMRGGR